MNSPQEDRFKRAYFMLTDRNNYAKVGVEGLNGELSAWAGLERPPRSKLRFDLRTLGCCAYSRDAATGADTYNIISLYQAPEGEIVAYDSSDVVTSPVPPSTRPIVRHADDRIPPINQALAVGSALAIIEAVLGLPQQSAENIDVAV